MTSIAVFGDPVLDHVYQLSDPIVTGGKMLGQFVGAFPGGTTANFACAVAAFGLPSAMVGRVAEGAEAALHREGFAAFGVDVERLAPMPVAHGTHTLLTIDPSGEKTLVYVPFDGPDLEEADIAAPLASHRLCYTMAADFDRIARHLTGSDAHVCVDADAAAGLDPDRFAAVRDRADTLFLNEVGFARLTGTEPGPDALAALLGPRLTTLCCTGGAGTTFLVTRDASGKVEVTARQARPARVVDTTGAGDVFNAAFLAERAAGREPEAALDFAMAAGALATETLGARAAIPTRAAVLARMAG